MTLDEFRHQMAASRRAAEEEAVSLKDSYLALDRLHAVYRACDAEERAMADQILGEWALSDDEQFRFDALTLIDDFQIRTAVPVLRELVARLASTSTPGAPYEQQKVNRIIRDLSEG